MMGRQWGKIINSKKKSQVNNIWLRQTGIDQTFAIRLEFDTNWRHWINSNEEQNLNSLQCIHAFYVKRALVSYFASLLICRLDWLAWLGWHGSLSQLCINNWYKIGIISFSYTFSKMFLYFFRNSFPKFANFIVLSKIAGSCILFQSI